LEKVKMDAKKKTDNGKNVPAKRGDKKMENRKTKE